MSPKSHPTPESHPWRKCREMHLLLKAKRKERKRIYERESPVRNDEFRRLTSNDNKRNRYRKAHGIPLDAPIIPRGKYIRRPK
jgi:cytidylate kinase